jgi:hypothetical protein
LQGRPALLKLIAEIAVPGIDAGGLRGGGIFLIRCAEDIK